MTKIYSMTGYAVGTASLQNTNINLELRSVNSRYLDWAFRLADEARFAEPALRDLIASCIFRGKIECRLNIQKNYAENFDIDLDQTCIQRLLAAQNNILTSQPQARPLSVADIIRWPGVITENQVSNDALATTIMHLAKEVLSELGAAREREGSKLKEILQDKLQNMREQIIRAKPLMPQAVADYRTKLYTRLQEAVAALDNERIAQEVNLFAQKIDIAEEISRLEVHLDEVARVLKKGGQVGKRLDFLMQELNREANTMASKSASIELTQIAMELKLLTEQMREQVQNLE